MEILLIVTNSPWTIIDTSKTKRKHVLPKTADQYFVSAKGSIPVPAVSGIKHKLNEISDDIDNDIMENTNKDSKPCQNIMKIQKAYHRMEKTIVVPMMLYILFLLTYGVSAQ